MTMHNRMPPLKPPSNPSKFKTLKPWKKFVADMTPEEIVLDGTRTLALSIIPREFPLFHDSEENYDRLDDAVARRYNGIWTPETVRFSIQYERAHLLWDKPPAPPPPPPPPPKPQYVEEKALESWQLPFPQADWQLRRASREQVVDYVSRLRKREAWEAQQKEIGQ